MTEVKTERDVIIDTAVKKITEAQGQRDKARRELITARAIIKELLNAFMADAEGTDAEAGLEHKWKAYQRGERFLSKGKAK